ncbi:glutamate 5-kinase [Vogesella alkaliphila]|uniref:Glutamate 5-kinase n=2 Tax=Vogesella alkaliphila TaxID=1193621 RepID=A0ABQ2Z035_9NEIS|nr:glutamate 5-kinase [Vogesella alkaliphila]
MAAESGKLTALLLTGFGDMQSVIHSATRIVVKVGSSLVTNDGKGLDMSALARWAAEIADLKRRGKEVVLVSSGAIAEGCQRLGWAKRPKAVHELQAAAAVGQMGLCQAYESAFREHGLKTAQVLLTHEDLSDRLRYLNARTTLSTLLALNVVPIINENDTVVTDEIRFGDNDTLGALVTNLIEADSLVILTDQQGLYTADPRKHPDAAFVHEAEAGDSKLEEMAGGAGSSVGTGGMYTKIIAAKRAARSGAATVIACGREANVLSRLADGEAIGTQLNAPTTRLAARKQWLADHLQLSGKVVLDAGAALAVREKGTSLLPIGVIAVEGSFLRGDAVVCVDEQHVEVARGLVNYSSEEARLIMRKATRDIEGVLGYLIEPELIHRDNMVAL